MKKLQYRKLNSRTEAETCMIELGNAQLHKQRLVTERDAAKLEIDTEYASPLLDVDLALQEKTAALEAWALAHPDEFPKGTKTCDLGTGLIYFRTGNPTLKPLSKWTWKRVTEAVMLKLPSFVRNNPEVDREAILAQRDELADFLPAVGLKIDQSEKFHAEPKLTEIKTRQTAEAR